MISYVFSNAIYPLNIWPLKSAVQFCMYHSDFKFLYECTN